MPTYVKTFNEIMTLPMVENAFPMSHRVTETSLSGMRNVF